MAHLTQTVSQASVLQEAIVPKIKQTFVKYGKAFDTGQQSGGGRIFITLFDICNEIRSGSPATESIGSRLESWDS